MKGKTILLRVIPILITGWFALLMFFGKGQKDVWTLPAGIVLTVISIIGIITLIKDIAKGNIVSEDETTGNTAVPKKKEIRWRIVLLVIFGLMFLMRIINLVIALAAKGPPVDVLFSLSLVVFGGLIVGLLVSIKKAKIWNAEIEKGNAKGD